MLSVFSFVFLMLVDSVVKLSHNEINKNYMRVCESGSTKLKFLKDVGTSLLGPAVAQTGRCGPGFEPLSSHVKSVMDKA
jgi:hypothetical protein